MSEVNREQILGSAAKIYPFDKVLRGYDTKQVEEYIDGLIASNKSATEMFDSRFNEMTNENTMLKYELEQIKQDLTRMTNMYNSVREEKEKLAQKAAKQVVVAQDNSAEIKEYEEKIDKLTSKNRLLQEDNKKLEEKNRDMQRDIAHLTKKVDKNRSKINNLTEQVEVGLPEDNKYYEITQIYEAAIDKAEDLIYRLQTELSLAHSKAEDAGGKTEEK
ncbi:MAG: hypothetical protein IJT65_03380 [Eubacterium sp.]|nr:hypothetical protein [Eubacterium sp.]